jgi:hypothetical protein
MLVALFVSASLLFPAGAGAEQLTARQQRMKSCNAEASQKHLLGGQRREFMSECLRG